MEYVFIKSLLINFLYMIIIDTISIILYYVFSKYKSEMHHNVRWFFIHFTSNILITYYGFDDLVYCINNIGKCALQPWSDNGLQAFAIACSSHLYHMILFRKKLKDEEWLHHITMCLISAPLTLFFNRTKPSIVGLWFLSGLPGMIDYFLLWLIKLGRLEKIFEKKVYILLSVLLRNPGCLFAVFLQLGIINSEINNIHILMKIILSCLTYWNGQYYMYITVRDGVKSGIYF